MEPRRWVGKVWVGDTLISKMLRAPQIGQTNPTCMASLSQCQLTARHFSSRTSPTLSKRTISVTDSDATARSRPSELHTTGRPKSQRASPMWHMRPTTQPRRPLRRCRERRYKVGSWRWITTRRQWQRAATRSTPRQTEIDYITETYSKQSSPRGSRKSVSKRRMKSSRARECSSSDSLVNSFN